LSKTSGGKTTTTTTTNNNNNNNNNNIIPPTFASTTVKYPEMIALLRMTKGSVRPLPIILFRPVSR
jgi:hypothetical protein